MNRQQHAAHDQTRFDVLSRHFWLEDFFIQKLERLETFFHARVRRPSFPRRLFALVLLVESVLVVCTGLFLSQEMSFEESGAVCEGRYATLTSQLHSTFNQELGDKSSQSDVYPRK